MTGLAVVWFDICCMIFVWIVVTHLLRARLGCWVLVWLFVWLLCGCFDVVCGCLLWVGC